MTFRQTVKADIARQVLVETGRADLNFRRVLRQWLNPRFHPVFLCRCAQFSQRRFKLLAKIFSQLNFHLYHIEISPKCDIGPGLYFPHTSGTVIGAWSLGANATIFQGVTLGAKGLDMRFSQEGRPTLLDDVTIGAGAKVLGGIRLGKGCSVGANAVVTRDVEDGDVVVGIPARPLKKGENV